MRVLGIDYGERRIGLAVSDASGTLARPLAVVSGAGDLATSVRGVLRALAEFEHADERVETIVVGLPKRLDGSANDQTARAEAFAALLASRSERPVVLQDERLTSYEADTLLAVRERDWRVRKQKLDAAAAAVILQEFLDTRAQPDAGRHELAAGSQEPGDGQPAPDDGSQKP
jgi:putative Holliday junction resolvase